MGNYIKSHTTNNQPLIPKPLPISINIYFQKVGYWAIKWFQTFSVQHILRLLPAREKRRRNDARGLTKRKNHSPQKISIIIIQDITRPINEKSQQHTCNEQSTSFTSPCITTKYNYFYSVSY